MKVESLTAARKSAMSGSEPSDAIRVVNAVLTQIDQIKRWLSIYIANDHTSYIIISLLLIIS